MYNHIKRFSDILLSLTGMILFLPFFIPLAILLLLTGEHYVFYRQTRIGYKNKKFKIWKFATMLKASPGLGSGSITVKNDWRLTPMGKYLRGSKVNEIPQLINIFTGEMSFVGPRPLMEVDFLKYPPEVQQKVYNVKPGLTGVASIIFRDEEKYFSETDMDPHEFDRQYIAPYKGRLEAWYQKNISFVTDLKIIYYTALVVINAEPDEDFKLLTGLPEKPDYMKFSPAAK